MSASIIAELSSNVATSPPTKKARFTQLADSNNTKPASVTGNEQTGEQRGEKMTADGNGGEKMETNQNELDKNLYSRQIYALGESAMMHLRSASVIISGLGGVGVEIAKNLILGGVRHVTLHDTVNTTWMDLSAQYYLNENDIGKNRAAACFDRLAELNDSVTCNLLTESLHKGKIENFDLVILADSSLSRQLEVSQWCRATNTRLVVADARGLFGFLFVDCGEKFVVEDPNGVACKEFLIEHIDAVTGDVLTLENSLHGLEDGEHVTFQEIKGMTELNGHAPIKITVKNPHTFNIGDAAKNLTQYVEGGRCRQVKVPSTISHKEYSVARENPESVIWDFAKFDAPQQHHALWEALYKFEETKNRRPAPHNDEDAATLKSFVKGEVDEKLIKLFSFQAAGNLVTVGSVLGGIAAQEAMKALTHHMTPLNQFMYMDHQEALPGDYSTLDWGKLTESDFKPRESRYDGQAAVFGWPYQEALFKQRWFIVGAGAIGCELLKNLAMMGVACGEQGLIKITDMDQIEISNLNRQFLFRRKDVGSKKSECAARSVQSFNKEVRIEALSEKVCPETEHIFKDEFFGELNGVLNALDNVDARRYMDRRCVYYRLPLLESGTMGVLGNTQVIFPHLTESYSSSVDPPEKDIPICTLKNFPNEIQHTIQWARDMFEGLFTGPAETANQFLEDEKGFLSRLEQMNVGQRMQMLSQVKEALLDHRPQSPEECVRWARLLFQEQYHNNIGQILHSFPPEQMTDHGAKFWSGAKRCPHKLDWDVAKAEHVNFVYAASILHAHVYGLQPILDINQVVKIASDIHPEPFKAKSGVKIAVTEAEAKEQHESTGNDDDDALMQLKLKLARLNTKTVPKLHPVDFEKDDDSNHHMEFVTAASNLRAENYNIQPADVMKTKQIAGRIIPAIATTTAAVAGLVCIEFYKMVENEGVAKTPMDRFKNGFINLALSFYTFSEPIAASKKKYNGVEWTLWDRLELKGPISLQSAIDWFQETTRLEVSMISSGVSLIYSFFMNNEKRKQRLPMDVKKVVEEVSKNKLPGYQKALTLEVMATNPENDEDVEVPYVRYEFV